MSTSACSSRRTAGLVASILPVSYVLSKAKPWRTYGEGDEAETEVSLMLTSFGQPTHQCTCHQCLSSRFSIADTHHVHLPRITCNRPRTTINPARNSRYEP
jgi:hypothetical protein